MVRPRFDVEHLDETVWLGEVAEQAPLVGAGASTVGLDDPHGVGEDHHLVVRHGVGHRHDHRAVRRAGQQGDDGVGAGHRGQIERVCGPELPRRVEAEQTTRTMAATT